MHEVGAIWTGTAMEKYHSMYQLKHVFYFFKKHIYI